MLTYLDAKPAHPEKYAIGVATPGSPHATLPAAFAIQHEVRDSAHAQGLGWDNDDLGDFGWMGGTGAYKPACFFNPKKDWAMVVLYNRGTRV
jgi:hypothetical protein